MYEPTSDHSQATGEMSLKPINISVEDANALAEVCNDLQLEEIATSLETERHTVIRVTDDPEPTGFYTRFTT